MKATKEQLLAILDDVRARVVSGDSLEGSIEYLLPPTDQKGVDFYVSGRYRVGNLEGQGSVRLLPADPEESD